MAFSKPPPQVLEDDVTTSVVRLAELFCFRLAGDHLNGVFFGHVSLFNK